DSRKGVGVRDVRDPKGVTRFTTHPWESTGPWLSYDRAQWHRGQFQTMAAGGIDVALAMYRGGAADRRTYALKGLDMMSQALKELRGAEDQPFSRPHDYPRLGMALDLRGLADQYGGPVDLKDPETRRSFQGMIRDFFLHVPPEFRATVQLPSARAGSPAGPALAPTGTAYVVRLIGDAAVKYIDEETLTEASKQVQAEFGARVLWIGTPALQARVKAFDAVAPYPAGSAEASINDTTWLRTAALGPGYDDTGAGGKTTIRPRDNGQLLVDDIRRVLQARPDWIVVDSWNDYATGSDIGPSLEFGLLYKDLFRAAVLQYKHSADYSAHFIRAGAPRVMDPGHVYQVEVVVQNTGTSDWDSSNLAVLTYRWLKDGQVIADRGATTNSSGHARGVGKSYLIGVAPIQEGKPLAPGDYELEFNMAQLVGNDRVPFPLEDTAPYRI
ncbi:MAG: putative cellulase and CBM, partial [bacterium]